MSKADMLHSLSSRLAFLYTTLFVTSSCIALVVFYLSIDSILNRQIDDDLSEDVEEFRNILMKNNTSDLIDEIDREMLTNDPAEVFFMLYRDDNIIHRTDTSPWSIPKQVRTAAITDDQGESDIFHTIRHGDYHARIITSALNQNIHIQIGTSTEDTEDFMALILQLFIITYILVTIIASLAGWLIARKALTGIETVSKAAIDVSNGSLERRVQVDSDSLEVVRLADSFNSMLDRIRELIFGMREMADNIAHDLRSPLGRIRAQAESTLTSETSIDDHRIAATDIMEECDRTLQLINNALDVSEAEVGIAEKTLENIDLSELMNDAYELFEPVAEDRQIELYLSVEPGCRLRGHNAHLQRVLSNFLDNALKYTPPKGRVGLELVSTEDAAQITIRDSGIGIEEDEQAKIFDRFYRCDESRTTGGNGLGLSFARAVILAHGGGIKLASTPGQGSIFTITLPM